MTPPVDSPATPAEDDSPSAATSDVEAGVEPDADVAEEFAQSVPVDPTPEQVEHYLDLVGDDDGIAADGS